MRKLLIIALLIVGRGQEYGCMNESNANYNALANTHVADSCAVQVYGCTDATALNYDLTATNMCAGITTNQCCTARISGCTDENYESYNENVNYDDGSCSGAINFGCMVQGSCNYNPNATSDCSKVVGGSNSNCCEASNTTSVVCVRDFDNDGFQDENTNSQTLASGNCGCSTLGYGWTNSANTNGEAIWGCMQPTCPEYDPEANRNDGNCCLGFTEADLLYMFGINYSYCLSAGNCIETVEYSLLGSYLLDVSDCQASGQEPSDYHEEFYRFLGYGGKYYEEILQIHQHDGYRSPLVYLPTYDSPADCETYAAGSNWFCGNQVADPDSYYPCEEEYFQSQCDQRDECWWEAPECRWNTSQWVGNACYENENMSNQSVCTADPGCQWNQQWNDCYFDCWGLSQATCQNAALGDECQWKTPDANDGFCSAPANNHSQCNAQGYINGECSDPNYTTEQACQNAGSCSNPTYTSEQACYSGGTCSIPEITTQQACENAGTCSNPAYTTEQACYNAGQNYWYNASWQWAYWDHAGNWWSQGESSCNGWDEWNDNTSQWEFVCECYAESETECTTNGFNWQTHGDAQCEYKPYDDGCGTLDNPGECNSAAASNNCKWDFQGGYCFKEQGADCWTLNSESQCGNNADCSWWTPPGYNAANVSVEFQNVVVPGVCNFYDWCRDYYCYDDDCDQSGCNDDAYCRWMDIPGQPKYCTENTQAQYCECYVEWSQSSCAQAGLTWDHIHQECMQAIEEFTCYNIDDLMLGSTDGNIDCGAFVAADIDHYTEWIPGANVCEDIFEESSAGTYTIEGDQLCHVTAGEFEEDACSDMDFAKCQCNLHRCNWMPNPTMQNPDAGTCDEGSMPPDQGGGRIKVEDHNFQNNFIDNFIYSNSSLNPEQCHTFTVQSNGNIHLSVEEPEGGSCTIIMIAVSDYSTNFQYYLPGNVFLEGTCDSDGNLNTCSLCPNINSNGYGNCDTALGYAFTGIDCISVTGCGHGTDEEWFFDTYAECNTTCQNCKVLNPDGYGLCEMVVGWGWTGEDCELISGCGAGDDAPWFYDTEEICNGRCSYGYLSNETVELPQEFTLSSYPNPFNPATTISFSIPEFGLTTITAYDINGRKLETLTNEVLSVGNYSINWNASFHPSGMYFVKIVAGDFTQTQKVVLVK